MKEIFERHQALLAPEERLAIWANVSGARGTASRPRMPWGAPVAGAMAMIVVAVMLFTMQQQAMEPTRPTTRQERTAKDATGPDEMSAREPAAAPPIVLPPSASTATPQRRLRIDSAPAPVTLGAPAPMASEAPAPAPAADMVPMEETRVTAQRLIDTKSSSTKQSVSGEMHVRAGQGATKVTVIRGAPSVPVVPTTGGTALPNDEAFDSMFFRNYGVNPFIAADEDPLSTFAVDVDAGSYTLMRRYLGLGELPPTEAVRVEEFVNFFPQDYPRFEKEDFRILIDGAPSPFGAGYQLLRVGLKGREIAEGKRKPAQLTFVIDVSGSMDRENRLELVKQALRLLVDELRGGDEVGIVVYGSQGRIVLEPEAIGSAGRRRILGAIEELRPDGSTNAEEGLQLGYAMARRAYRPDAINRIVLCSDGVANVGRTGPESILAQVRSAADDGIQLTTIGFGMGNYNDVLMEQLADKGDGNHYYVDRIEEAQRVFVENLTGTLQTIAKDAKVQVEFDSTRVLRYRLIGFENRDVADRDFRNDQVDAGEIGGGHEVTALYEVKLAPGVTRGRLATVRLRYAQPEQDGGGAPQVREMERSFHVEAFSRKFEDAAPRFRFDAAVAEFAEILRGSYWAKESRLSAVLSVARSAASGLDDEATVEFVSLVEKAADLRARADAVRTDERR